MSEPRSTSELVAGWWQHHWLLTSDREARKRLDDGYELFADAGWEGVSGCMDGGGVEALDLIDALLIAAPDGEDGAGRVGAGLLEDLLHEHGAELIKEVERRAFWVLGRHTSLEVPPGEDGVCGFPPMTSCLTSSTGSSPVAGAATGQRWRLLASGQSC